MDLQIDVISEFKFAAKAHQIERKHSVYAIDRTKIMGRGLNIEIDPIRTQPQPH